MYALVDIDTDRIIAGEQYQLSFTFIADFLDEYEANPNRADVLRKMNHEGRLRLKVRPHICEATMHYMYYFKDMNIELLDDQEIPNVYTVFEVAINALSILTKAEFYKTFDIKGNKSYTNEVIGDNVLEELYNLYKSGENNFYCNDFLYKLFDISARLAFLDASSGGEGSNKFDDFREAKGEIVMFCDSDEDNEYGYFRHYGTSEWMPMTKPESEYIAEIANGDYSSITISE